MNNSNPLIPQGSLLEQQNRGRARVKVAVYCVIAFHVVFLGGLLMLGCKKEQATGPTDDTTTQNASNTPDTNTTANNTPNTTTPDTNLASAPGPLPPVPNGSNSSVAPAPVQPTPAVTTPPPPIPTAEAPATPASNEYVVAKGDTFATIARKNHISVRAIQNANPTVNPNRLKIGQKLELPAPASNAGGSAATMAATGGTGNGDTYTVRSGDSLFKIAKNLGVSVKALRAANPVVARTDRIKVGQKLNVPARSGAPATTDAAPAPAPMAPAPQPYTPPPLPGPGSAPAGSTAH